MGSRGRGRGGRIGIGEGLRVGAASEEEEEEEGAWVTIPAPPFAYAGLVIEGRMEVGVALDAFRRHVAKGDGDSDEGYGAFDVKALMYLTGQLTIMGRL